jgi:hypothetical protein
MNITTQKLDKKELLSSFDDTITELVQALSLFSEEELNTIPFEGSWTAGQVGEHLLKSDYGITKLLLGNTQLSKRPIDEKVEFIESIFLDFTKKAISAKAIWPSDDDKEKEKLIGALKATMDDIRKTAGALDLSLLCMDFPFPTLGELTRWEWITFVICHTKKHIYQIKNIYKKIKD